MSSHIKQPEKSPIRWDAHGCPPFKIDGDLSFLHRYKNAGVDYISLNVGFDLTPKKQTLSLLTYFNDWIKSHSKEYAIPNNTQDIRNNKASNKLNITFDLEGTNLLHDDLTLVSELHSLGIKQIVFAYNKNNSAGGGCLDVDGGLTAFGKKLLNECNRLGIVIDCSHVGYKTSLDIINLSEHPVIFSHSNPAKLLDHPRNIQDDQIKECAKNGGVIGINGVGIFLGNNNTSSNKIVEHIDYVVQLVGPKHVGIGLDCVFDQAEINLYVKNHPDTFPENHGFKNVTVAEPEQSSEIGNLLKQRGYDENDINDILGENFFRIAQRVWI